MQNGFIYLHIHEHTQIGNYNLVLIAHNPINLEGKCEKSVSIGPGSDVCDCTCSIFPFKKQYYQSPLSSKSLHQHLSTWCQLSLLYSSPIGLVLILHPVFMELSCHETPPPMIWYSPVELGVYCVRSQGTRGNNICKNITILNLLMWMVFPCWVLFWIESHILAPKTYIYLHTRFGQQ